MRFVLLLACFAVTGCRSRTKSSVSEGPVQRHAIFSALVESTRGPFAVPCSFHGTLRDVVAKNGTRVNRGQVLARYWTEGSTQSQERVLGDGEPEIAVVEKVFVEAGMRCAPGNPMMMLLDPTHLQAAVELTGDATSVRAGASVVFRSASDRRTEISSSLEQVSDLWTQRGGRLVRLAWAALPDGGSFTLNEELEADVNLGAVNVVRVPRQAIEVRDGRAYLTTVRGQDVAVTVGAVDSEFAEVTGIKAGEELWMP